MTKRTYLLILIFILLATAFLSVVFIILQRNKDGVTPSGEPAATEIKTYQKLSGIKPDNAFGPVPVAPRTSSVSAALPPKSSLINKIPLSEMSSLPQTVPVQKIDKTKPLTRLQAQTIADYLGLTGLPTRLSDNTLTWKSADWQLIYDSSTSTLSLYSLKPLGLHGPSIDEAVRFANEFLLKNNLSFPDLAVESASSAAVVLDPDSLTKVSPTEPHNAVYVPIVRVGELPHSSDPSDGSNRYMTIGEGNQIINFSLSYYPISQLAGYYQASDINEHLDNFSQSRHTIFLDDPEKDPLQITSLTLNHIRLVSYEGSNNRDYLYPFYEIKGTATFRDGSASGVTVLIDALRR